MFMIQKCYYYNKIWPKCYDNIIVRDNQSYTLIAYVVLRDDVYLMPVIENVLNTVEINKCIKVKGTTRND